MHFKSESTQGRQGADVARHAQEQGKYSGSDANIGGGADTPNDISSDPKKSANNERSIQQKTSKPTDGEQIDEE